jgi:acetyl-CoA synthetase
MNESSPASRAYRAGQWLANGGVDLAPYQRLRRIEFVDELPKAISGKIRRVELRDRENALESIPAEFRDR